MGDRISVVNVWTDHSVIIPNKQMYIKAKDSRK